MARFLVDESLPRSLATDLTDHGDQAVHVSQIGLSGSSDERIYREAITRTAILLTADLDFGDVRRFPPDHGTVIVRLRRRVPRDVLRARVAAMLADAEDDLRDVANKVLILESGRRRVRRVEGKQ